MLRLVTAVLTLALVAPVLGQKTQKVPTQQNAAQQNAPTQPAAAVPTLRTNTRLVFVDVIVTDKNQKPVHNLKASDFTLLESRAPQDFKIFEEHVAPAPADALKLQPMPKLPPGVFTNFSVVPANGPLNILLLDRLNTAVQDQARVQGEITEYLKRATPGTRIAIFGLTDKLVLLQGFTSDPEILKAVVSGKTKSRTSPLLDDKVGGSGAQTNLSDVAAANASEMSATGQMGDLVDLMKQFETQNSSFQSQLRAKYTLDAMNLMARYLSAFPGRKNLIWFSGSFPINVLPDPELATAKAGGSISSQDPFAGVASSEAEFRETTALLSRSQVAVYPIGAKGLTTYSNFEASSSDETGTTIRQGGKALQNSLRSQSQQTFDEHSTMFAMADDTGGKAAVDTNGLAKAIGEAIENGSNYYTIAYSPTNPHWDGAFRSIQVKLNQQGYNLSYRRGYFADDPDVLATSASTGAADSSRSMLLALIHGGPTPTQIMFSTRIQPLSAAAETTVANGNKVAKEGKGPYSRYRINFIVDPTTLHFTLSPDGTRHESIEFVTRVYDNEGALINSQGSLIKANVIPAAYAQFQRTGIPFRQDISVPAKGPYYLRIAILDVEQDRVGALEFPAAIVRNLPPPAPAAAPAK